MLIALIIVAVIIACFASYGAASARDYENGGSKTFWNRNDWDLQQTLENLIWEKMEKNLNIIDADCEDINIYADKLIEKWNLPPDKLSNIPANYIDEARNCAEIISRRDSDKLDDKAYDDGFDYEEIRDKKTYELLKEYIPQGETEPCKYFKEGCCNYECEEEGCIDNSCWLLYKSNESEEFRKEPYEDGITNWYRKNYYDKYKKTTTIWQRYQNFKDDSHYYDKFSRIVSLALQREMYRRKYDIISSYESSDKYREEEKKKAIEKRKNYPWL